MPRATLGAIFRVYTTIDLAFTPPTSGYDTLANLDQIFAKRKKNPLPPGTLQAALVALNPKTGEILAMVGGRDYGQSQLNRAVDANRQPGSVFKPIVYATALNTARDDLSDDVITPASMFMDAPETFYYGRGQTYSPENFGKTYSNRNVSVRDGLVHSLNYLRFDLGQSRPVKKRAPGRTVDAQAPALPCLALGTAEATRFSPTAYTPCNGGNLTVPGRSRLTMRCVSITETMPDTLPRSAGISC